jgi:hypothetical protein
MGARLMAHNPHNLGAGQLMAQLRDKYPTQEYALLEEVGNATGFGCQRHADAIAMGLWPSRGLQVIGFEVKCYRQDWLRELAKPEKAEAVAKFCDKWWLVAPTAEMVPVSELPPTWGLYVSDGTKLVVKKQAPQLEPQPLSRGFVAAVLRKASEGQAALVRSAKDAAFMQAREEFNAKPLPPASVVEAELRKDVSRMRTQIDDFEKASGVKIKDYNSNFVGEAVARVLALHMAPERDIVFLQKRAKDMAKSVAELVKAIELVKPKQEAP